jgi:hypothetical protein
VGNFLYLKKVQVRRLPWHNRERILTANTERLFVLALVGGLSLFFLLCSCEKENLIDPPDFFEAAESYSSGNPDFWSECDHSCGLLTPPSQPVAAPPPGGDVFICTGPNPTSGPICIEYVLQSETDVAMSVYSQKGEKLRTLVRARQPALTHYTSWDLTDDSGREVPNGTFRVFFKADDYVTHGDIIVRR